MANPATLPGNPGGRPNAATPARDTTWQILTNSAKRHGIPAWLLVGVFGAESSFGKSSNWFGLGTPGGVPRSTYGVDATGKHYDSKGLPTFSGDADVAAATLSRLTNYYKGNTDQALAAYSGNGYATIGAQHGYKSATAYIRGLAGQAPTHVNQTTSLGQDLATSGPANALASALTVPEKFLALVTSLEFWLRIGEGIAGLVLIAMGLKSLTGISLPSAVPVPV